MSVLHDEPEWVHRHVHEPNPTPPAGDGTFSVILAKGSQTWVAVDDLRALPQVEIANCTIVSTGHGVSGPFVFGGVRLSDLMASVLAPNEGWREVDVIGHDGFGTRLTLADVQAAPQDRPILLAFSFDGAPLTRKQGLVRLVVPTETDDALRQVKWIERIVVR